MTERSARTADPASRPDELPGRGIVVASWVATGLFALTAAGDAVGVGGAEPVAIGVAVALFAVGIVVWLVAFVGAVGRSRTDEITLTGLFLLVGTAPRPVQVHLVGSLAVAVVVAAATAAAAPFGVLEPVLQLALAGLWGARHGRFGPRRRGAGR